MSTKLYASFSNEIPWEIIKEHCPSQVKVIDDMEESNIDKLIEFAEDNLDDEDENFDKLLKATNEITTYFKEKYGLDLCFYYRACVDEESSGNLSEFYFDVENAFTVNPKFTEVVGARTPITTSWVTF